MDQTDQTDQPDRSARPDHGPGLQLPRRSGTLSAPAFRPGRGDGGRRLSGEAMGRAVFHPGNPGAVALPFVGPGGGPAEPAWGCS